MSEGQWVNEFEEVKMMMKEGVRRFEDELEERKVEGGIRDEVGKMKD